MGKEVMIMIVIIFIAGMINTMLSRTGWRKRLLDISTTFL